MGTLLSVFGIKPFRIGGQEAFARELSFQLGLYGWKSVLCFAGEPQGGVRRYLQLPNVSFEVLDNPERVHWRGVVELGRLLQRHCPDVLHLYYMSFLGPYPWLARLYSVPRVFFTDQTSREANYVPRRAAVWKRGLTRCVNWPIVGVVCVCQYGYRCMTALDVLPPERFVRIYNGVDFSRVPGTSEAAEGFRRRYSIPAGRSLVVQVSWIIPEKGIVDLLQAARLVLSRNRNVQFVLVGEGSHREEYTGLAAEMGLGDHVTWTGLVEDPFKEGVYAAADVVCQVSRWEELFGYVVAEAMASGKPVVATRVGGIPELVQDGETGFLVPRGDAARMAEKILLLLEDSLLREQMGCTGRQLAKAKFDLKQNVSQLLRLYAISPWPVEAGKEQPSSRGCSHSQ
jgi:glycosyltransferase involved in cell wall biosynthesis